MIIGGEYTVLDNFLNPFWLWVASLLPLWVSQLLAIQLRSVRIWGASHALFGGDVIDAALNLLAAICRLPQILSQ